MTHEEWESLCDGCARCCLHKLEDDDDGRMYYTKAACSLLDIGSCRCKDYDNRQLSIDNAHYFDWLPSTCAYRLLAEGEPLPDWHPLITGDPDSVHKAGISVRDIAQPEDDIDDLTEAVIGLSHEPDPDA